MLERQLQSSLHKESSNAEVPRLFNPIFICILQVADAQGSRATPGSGLSLYKGT
jgi:hypothetical protein